MPIHRLIFRIDFPLNIDIVDYPGKIMGILNNIKEGFWDVRDNPANRQIIGGYKSDEFSRVLTIEPTAAYGSIESLKGWSIEQLSVKGKDFLELADIFDKIIKEFSIDNIKRAGLRMYYFSRPIDATDRLHRAFRISHSSKVISLVENSLGEISDYSLAFDGANEDKIKYHFKCGPYNKKEAGRYLAELPKAFGLKDDYNFTCDLDLYENDFSIPYGAFARWCRPLWVRAQETLDNIESLLIKQTGKE